MANLLSKRVLLVVNFRTIEKMQFMNNSNNIEQLKQRFKDWAIKGVIFTRKFPSEADFKAIRNQMVRCIPSAAANYRSACRAKSNPDFINKLKIVEEELDESMFWFEFIVGLEPNLRVDTVWLYKEADELLKITVSSIKTAREKEDAKKKK
jgi:four helix bundle protein